MTGGDPGRNQGWGQGRSAWAKSSGVMTGLRMTVIASGGMRAMRACVLRDALGDGDDAVELGIEQANRPVAQATFQGAAPRHGRGEVGPQAQHDAGVGPGQRPGEDRDPPGPVFGGQEGGRAALAQIVGQGGHRHQGVFGAQVDPIDLRRDAREVRALGAHQDQVDTLAEGCEAAGQARDHPLDPAGTGEGDEDGNAAGVAVQVGAHQVQRRG